ncbi:MAG: hypothetical protein IJS15_04705, partial [Victivallales bacterium]|nr:hypothetical protein [Victivallales bacterium]
PTTWVSKHGEVPLKHLEVKPETRIPWRAGVEGNNIVYHCDKPIPEKAREILEHIAADNGARFDTDGFGVTRLVIPKENAKHFFEAFNEDKVEQLTHPNEHELRRFGGDGLLEANLYEPFEPATDYKDPRPPLTKDQLPELLDIEDDTGHVVKLPKIHYETMATTSCSGVHRPRSVDELRAMMEARIHRGNEILRSVLSGNVSRFEANEQNIAALTIALHAAALKKGEFMYRGSFSVADPNGNIARWLDTADKLYQRTSTHAKPYQELNVDGHLNMPRGYDVREGMGGLLNGMRTFHYFSLPDMDHLADKGGCGPKRRLFLKCETYGIFMSTAHFHPFKKADARTEGMKTRNYQFGDICESIAHGSSLLVSKFTSKTKAGIRKEDLPENVTNAVNEAISTLKANGFNALAEHPIISSALNGGGVKMFLDYLNSEMKKMPDDDAIKVMRLLEPSLSTIDNALKELNGGIDYRMGNEIMLDAEDFGL